MTRDKRGRFAVNVENPDCEVATRGYVKHIARVVANHTHYSDDTIFQLSIAFTICILSSTCIVDAMHTASNGMYASGFIGFLVTAYIILSRFDSCKTSITILPKIKEIKKEHAFNECSGDEK